MNVTREMLMAYADGELGPHARAQVDQAIVEDPTLADEIERHRRLRRRVAAAYEPLLERPVPEALVARIRSAPLAPPRDGSSRFAAARMRLHAATRDWTPRRLLPLAATLLLGLVLGAMVIGQGARSSGMIVADPDGLRARGALAVALTERLSSDPMTGSVAVGLSFRDEAGAYCRTFVVHDGEGLSGFACRQAGAWRVRMAVADAPAAAGDDLRPAGTALPRAVLLAIEDAIEGDPLDADAEAAALARGWRD
jgi:hypothetical protein